MTSNHIQLNLDLDTDTGVKALLALAGAFGGVPVVSAAQIDTSKLMAPTAPEPEAPRPPASADIEPGSTSTSATSGQPAAPAAASATPPAGEKPKRRRTKAQKEEDERDGLDDAFQKALKEHPDLDVDTLRDMIRGNREAVEAEVAAAGHAAEAVPEAFVPDDSADGVDNVPPASAPDAFDPVAEPTGFAPSASVTESAGWNPPWAQ